VSTGTRKRGRLAARLLLEVFGDRKKKENSDQIGGNRVVSSQKKFAGPQSRVEGRTRGGEKQRARKKRGTLKWSERGVVAIVGHPTKPPGRTGLPAGWYSRWKGTFLLGRKTSHFGGT